MEKSSNPTYLYDLIGRTLSPVKTEQQLKSFVREILQAIAYIHLKGFVHADLKLENITLTKDSKNDFQIKIIDFGISQPIGPEGYAVFPTRCGTSGYFAPEMKGTKDIRVTSAIDIWAIGVIIYEMSVAYKPTSFRNYKYGSGPIPFR